jgi:hypothetical protein
MEMVMIKVKCEAESTTGGEVLHFPRGAEAIIAAQRGALGYLQKVAEGGKAY